VFHTHTLAWALTRIDPGGGIPGRSLDCSISKGLGETNCYLPSTLDAVSRNPRDSETGPSQATMAASDVAGTSAHSPHRGRPPSPNRTSRMDVLPPTQQAALLWWTG
jgi:hypothetical protein